jgi:dethiobiotin synthetase
MRCNLLDLPDMGAGPLAGVLTEGMGGMEPRTFTEAARRSLGAGLGGTWEPPEGV